MSKNVFDNDEFFENYKKVRVKSDSYNNLLEQPAIKPLLPNLSGKTILDMGCGFGFSCVEFRKKGAMKVIGIDISEKMVNAANSENTDENLIFMKLDIDKIDTLGVKFDIVYSSMTMHYIADFAAAVKKVHSVLNDGGVFVFSQEHPLVTAAKAGPIWITDENDVKTAAPISDYLENGERNYIWFETNVTKQHRSFSAIVNSLLENEFIVEKVVEPTPDARVLEIAPRMYDEMHRPTAIVIKARKA